MRREKWGVSLLTMASANPLELKILGQRIPLKAGGMDPDLVREVVDLVAAKVESAEKRCPQGVMAYQVAVLALLDLGEEYLQAKRRTEAFKADIEERSERLLDLIEANLK